MAVCSEIHTKHINTVCGQNVELLNVKLAVHIVTTGLQRVSSIRLFGKFMKERHYMAAIFVVSIIEKIKLNCLITYSCSNRLTIN